MASRTWRLGEFLVEAETRDELEPRAHEAKIDASRFLSAGTAIVDSGLASGAESNSLLAPTARPRSTSCVRVRSGMS